MVGHVRVLCKDEWTNSWCTYAWAELKVASIFRLGNVWCNRNLPFDGFCLHSRMLDEMDVNMNMCEPRHDAPPDGGKCCGRVGWLCVGVGEGVSGGRRKESNDVLWGAFS